MQFAWDAPTGPHDLVYHQGALLPLSIDEPWETVTKAAAQGTVLGILPPLPQYVMRLLRAVRSVGKPLITFPPEKSQGALALMRQLPITALVAEAQDMPALYAALTERGHANTVALHAILTPHEAPLPGPYVHEVHLVPSMVILYQCAHLAAQNKPHFHPSRRFVWEVEGTAAYLTAAGRFARHQLPGTYKLEETNCPCGETQSLLYI